MKIYGKTYVVAYEKRVFVGFNAPEKFGKYCKLFEKFFISYL